MYTIASYFHSTIGMFPITTDQDIGYGPSIDTPSAIKEDYHDHPLAPPVTSPDGFMDESADVSKFSSNIIMSRKSDQVREVCPFTYSRKLGKDKSLWFDSGPI